MEAINKNQAGKGIAIVINPKIDKKLHGVDFMKKLKYMQDNHIRIAYNEKDDHYLTITQFRYPVHFQDWNKALIINLESNKLVIVDKNGWTTKYIANLVKDEIVKLKIKE